MHKYLGLSQLWSKYIPTWWPQYLKCSPLVSCLKLQYELVSITMWGLTIIKKSFLCRSQKFIHAACCLTHSPLRTLTGNRPQYKRTGRAVEHRGYRWPRLEGSPCATPPCPAHAAPPLVTCSVVCTSPIGNNTILMLLTKMEETPIGVRVCEPDWVPLSTDR